LHSISDFILWCYCHRYIEWRIFESKQKLEWVDNSTHFTHSSTGFPGEPLVLGWLVLPTVSSQSEHFPKVTTGKHGAWGQMRPPLPRMLHELFLVLWNAWLWCHEFAISFSNIQPHLITGQTLGKWFLFCVFMVGV
jgi:hypothetical protein